MWRFMKRRIFCYDFNARKDKTFVLSTACGVSIVELLSVVRSTTYENHLHTSVIEAHTLCVYSRGGRSSIRIMTNTDEILRHHINLTYLIP